MGQTQTSYYQSLYEAAAIVNSARAPETVLHSIAENVAKSLGVCPSNGWLAAG